MNMAKASSASTTAPAATATAVIAQVENLTKRYGSQRGVDDVSFEIADGEVFGFLGPNGAGKTTTMRTLMGLLRPTSGNATISGLDCWKQSTAVKKLVGYLPGEFTFDPGLRGRQIILAGTPGVSVS